MKKALTLLVLLLTGSMTYAQLKKGTITAGLDFTYSLANIDSSSAKNSDYSFGPELGYFLKDNWEGILIAKRSISSYDLGGPLDSRYTYLGFGVRKYFPVTEKFAPFVSLTASAGFGEVKSNGTLRSEFDFVQTTLRTGVNYFITKHIGLKAQINVVTMDFIDEKGISPGAESKQTSNVHFDISNALTFGVSYYFF